MSTSHTEFFGPDLGRGPFAAHRIETAVIQIATALAQLRTPLLRSDSDIQAHVDFIRTLADRLAPTWASQMTLEVGDKTGNNITTEIRTALDTVSLLHCWLTDENGVAEAAATPDVVTWNTGTILETITSKKRYLVLTPTTGVVNVTVTDTDQTYRWAVTRYARTHFSALLEF
ncbi:MAG: hypothetical protein KKB50_06855 [Planctomycetes bacterium]|nr:hypothetical protein [Planctomycetota bacterium]